MRATFRSTEGRYRHGAPPLYRADHPKFYRQLRGRRFLRPVRPSDKSALSPCGQTSAFWLECRWQRALFSWAFKCYLSTICFSSRVRRSGDRRPQRLADCQTAIRAGTSSLKLNQAGTA
jgi:hypothetical protein